MPVRPAHGLLENPELDAFASDEGSPSDVRPGRASLAARPLAVIGAAFAAGDAAGLQLPLIRCAAVAALACVGAAVLVGARRRDAALVLISLAFLLLGMGLGRIAAVPGPRDPSRFAFGRTVDLKGRVAGEPEQHADGWRCTLAVEQVLGADGSAVDVEGMAAVWVRLHPPAPRGGGSRQDPHAKALVAVEVIRSIESGDFVTVHGRLERPGPVRNEGTFDSKAYLAARGIHCTLLAKRPTDLRAHVRGLQPPFHRLARSVRDSFDASMRRIMEAQQADILSGIVFGARSSLPETLEDDFSRTGTVHVLATAGLHVGIVAAALMSICRLLRLSRRSSAIVTIFCLAVYALAAGGRPAVSRAVLMATLYLVAYLLDREPDGPTALAAAAILLLGWRPELLLDVGFQLSFATVACIFALLRWFEDRRPEPPTMWSHDRHSDVKGRVGRWSGSLFLLSLAAQLGSAPLTAQHFHLFSPISVAANLLVVPAVFVVLVASLLLWPVGLLLPPLGQQLAEWSVVPLTEGIVAAVRGFARVPGGSWSVPSPGWPFVILYYGVLLGLAARFTHGPTAEGSSTSHDERPPGSHDA
jgi:competence protein ComEC